MYYTVLSNVSLLRAIQLMALFRNKDNPRSSGRSDSLPCCKIQKSRICHGPTSNLNRHTENHRADFQKGAQIPIVKDHLSVLSVPNSSQFIASSRSERLDVTLNGVNICENVSVTQYFISPLLTYYYYLVEVINHNAGSRTQQLHYGDLLLYP